MILKRFLIAVVPLSLLVVASGGLTPSSAQSSKPVQEVSVVNAPTVQAQQAGQWTVGAQLAPGSTVGISGIPAVSISGTPTVNVASLPASGLDVRPVLPAAPKNWGGFVDNTRPDMIVGSPDALAIGLTSITLTNFHTSETALIRVLHPVLPASDTCTVTGTPIQTVGSVPPEGLLFVPARSTLHLTYPTPLVFSRADAASCVWVRLEWFLPDAGVRVNLNGFAQY